MAQDDNFDIAEEVARCLAMRSHEAISVTPQDHDGPTALVGGFQYNGSLINGSYYNYLTAPVIDETYDSSTVSPDSDHGMYTQSSCPTSTKKRSAVGRKPPKGPDGIRRYSNRRATYERRDRINLRERDRMHQLCDAFERLRQVLPMKRFKEGPNLQKLSKISTLVLAQNYIRALETMLEESPDDDSTSTEELDTNGLVSSPTNIAQTNGHSSAYYSVGEATEFQSSSGTIKYLHDAEQINVNYTHEYYRMEATTQYQCS